MLDTQFGVLSNAHRRQLLFDLLEDNPLDDRTVTSSDSETSDDGLNQTIALAHVHLPRMVDQGYIHWNRVKHRVTKGSRFDETRPLLTVLKGMEDRRSDDGSFD